MNENNPNQKKPDQQQQGTQKPQQPQKPGSEPVRAPQQGNQPDKGNMDKKQDQSFGDKRGGIEGDPGNNKGY